MTVSTSLKQRMAMLLAERDQLRADVERLAQWQATVTAALGRPGGAFYEDVPKHIRQMREALKAVPHGVVQEVAELPDRDSPDGWPEAMLVTSEELRIIVEEHLSGALGAPAETP